MCKRIWLTLAALVFAAQTVAASNLIVNGDFSAGNIGFQTDYLFQTDDPFSDADLWEPNTFGIDNAVPGRHPYWTDVPDHTGSGGNMMLVNGRTDAVSTVWRQTVAVAANTDYFFEGFGMNLCCNSAGVTPQNQYAVPELLFYINGVLLASNFTDGPGVWVGFSNMWNSAGNALAVLEVKNNSTFYNGNDFGLDDLYLGTESSLTPAPEPTSMLLLGTGMLFGVRFVRRRRAAVTK